MAESERWPRDAETKIARSVLSSAEDAFWVGLAVFITAGLVPIRARIGTVHVAILYLLAVLLASARRGRGLGLALAIS